MKRHLVLIAVLVAVLTLSLVACQHVHTFSQDWTFDDNKHWHAATCEHTDEKSDEAPHSFDANGRCICGKTIDPDDSPNHVHTYTKSWMFDKTNHWHGASCKHAAQIKDKQAHNFVDGVCSVCGAWQNVSETLLSQLSKSDVWNYYWTVENFNLGDVNGDGVNYLITSGEIKLSLDGSFPDHSIINALSGQGVINVTATVPTEGEQTQSSQMSMKCVVENGMLLAVSNEDENELYIRQSVDSLLKSDGSGTVNQLLLAMESAEENLDQIYAYLNQVKYSLARLGLEDMLDELPDLSEIKLDGTDGLIAVDTDLSTNSLTAYKFNFSLLRKLNDTLASTTVKQYVDKLLGEGVYDQLPEIVGNVLDYTVGDVLEMLEAQGVTLDKIISVMDSVVAAQYPDENVNTVNDLIKALMAQNGVTLPMEIDVKQMILLYKNTTLLDLVAMIAGGTNGGTVMPTKEQIVAQVEQMLDGVKNLTAYDILAQSIPDVSAQYIDLFVKEAINVAENNFKLRVFVGQDGLSKITFTVVPAVIKPIHDDMTDDEKAVTAYFNEIKTQLKDVGGTVTVGKDRILDTDYSDVASKVEEAYGKVAFPDTAQEMSEFCRILREQGGYETAQFSQHWQNMVELTVRHKFTMLLDGVYCVNVEVEAQFNLYLINAVSLTKVSDTAYALVYDLQRENWHCVKEPYVTKIDDPSFSQSYVDFAVEQWSEDLQYAESDSQQFAEMAVWEIASDLTLVYDTATGEFSVPDVHADSEQKPVQQ